MLYAICLLTFAVIVLIIVIMNKNVEIDAKSLMSAEDLEGNLKNLAIVMRNPERVGASPKVSKLSRKLKRAYILISEKVKREEELYNYERWVLENYFAVTKWLDRKVYREFAGLPHKFKETRVLIASRFLAAATKYNITKESVDALINTFNTHTPLHIDEISAIKSAIAYALCERIANIAYKSIKYDKLKKLAERKDRAHGSYSTDDCYLYWRKRLGKAAEYTEDVLASDINFDNIEYTFTTVLIDHLSDVENSVKSLSRLDDMFAEELNVEYSYANSLMAKSEVYSRIDTASKIEYLKAVERLADKYDKTEKWVIDRAFALEERSGEHFGRFLFPMRIIGKPLIMRNNINTVKIHGTRTAQRFYSFVVFALNTLVAAAFGLLTGNVAYGVPVAILSWFAFLRASEFLVQKAHKYLLFKRPVFKLNYQELPDDMRTVVVVPELITDKESLERAVKHIVTLREGNGGKNIRFAMLIDYKKANNAITPGDVELNKRAEQLLGGYADISYYQRKRSRMNGRFSAYERKRGAINAFNNALISGDYSEFFCVINRIDFLPEYVVVLDADSALFPDTVLSAINKMAHPLNAKYQVMAFKSAYNMFSMNSLYAEQFYFDSGYESYGGYSDYYYNACGYSVFCGKGVYRLSAFNDKLADIFPDGKVLSHDIIEGAILKTGSLDETVFEDAPLSLAADVNRRNRWFAGDIRLAFMRSKITNSKGKTTEIDKEPIYNYVMQTNLYKGIGEICLFGLLLFALFTMNVALALPFIICYFLPPIVNLLTVMDGVNKGIRLRYVLRGLVITAFDCIVKLFTIPLHAFYSLFVLTDTLARMAFDKSRELKWTTFAEAQRGNAMQAHAAVIAPVFACLAIIALLSAAHPFVLLYILASYTVMLALYATGIEYEGDFALNSEQKNTLKEYAERTYAYFDKMRENGVLICDNYQVKPYRGKSGATSPTNLGFSLLAEVCAAELGIITESAATENIQSQLIKINSLKKYKGHLYNWYDVKTDKILHPRYISSVDSGNFIACVIAVRQFLKSRGEDYSLCDKLIDNTDFGFLLDKSRNLFRIGYDTALKKYEGHYDLAASEAQLLYYVYAGLSRNVAPWNKLARDISGIFGNTLLSWSGTAFEYLMPSVFIRGARYGLIESTNRNAVKAQIAESCRGVWGISESGYYMFDNALNYQYHAFGINSLAKRSEFNRRVISPYSSGLALAYNLSAAVQNLKELRNRGMYGEYGFYEALDNSADSSDGRIVYSYMTHHQGMSLAAMTNALTDGAICRYFMADERMGAAGLLLTERKIMTKSGRKPALDNDYSKFFAREEYDRVIVPNENAKATALTSGKYSVVLEDTGEGYSRRADRFIFKYRYGGRGYGVHAYFTNIDANERIAPTIMDGGKECKARFGLDQAVFSGAGVEMSVFTPHCICGEVRKLSVYSANARKLKFTCYADLMLSGYDQDAAHPAFNDMFISTSYDEGRQAIIAARKSRGSSGKECYAAMALCGGENVRAESNRENVYGRSGDKKSISFGDVLYPCFSFECDVNCRDESVRELYFAILYSDRLDELNAMIDSVRDAHFIDYAYHSSQVQSLSVAHNLLRSPEVYGIANTLMSKILRGVYGGNSAQRVDYGVFSRLGFDSERKTVVLKDFRAVSIARDFVNIVMYLNVAGVGCNLLIVYEEKDKYHRSVYNRITEECGELPYYVKAINEDECDPEYLKAAFILTDGEIGAEEVQYDKQFDIMSEGATEECDVRERIDGSISLRSGNGGFIDGGYAVLSTPNMPYSNVVCGQSGGFVITENGGGYTYAHNSRENKITEWNNDPVCDEPSERLYLVEQGKATRINRLAGGAVIHSKGESAFICEINGIKTETSVYLAYDGLAKVYDVSLENVESRVREINLCITVDFCGGWKRNHEYIQTEEFPRGVKFTNRLTCQTAYLAAVTGGEAVGVRKSRLGDYTVKCEINAVKSKLILPDFGSQRAVFILTADEEIAKSADLSVVAAERVKMKEYFASVTPIELNTADECLNMLFNNLSYQMISSRLNGKCGYYQAGGAIGFRDQLQDCLAMLYVDANYVRRHIIECAARQFIEGDVLHWWHLPNIGVRTKISDDKLFLPFVACEYIKFTGDDGILTETVCYLEGEKLAEGQHDAYSAYKSSGCSGSIREHCKKAIDSALKYGEHGLLLIGTGDWNDALNGIGEKGRGESVWLTMFAYDVISKFIEFLPEEERLEYIKILDKLRFAIKGAFNNGWFRRAYTDDGEWLGDAESNVCKIDLLAQSFAVISDCADKRRARVAMLNAYRKLVDKDMGIIKLLAPPFNSSRYYGYIGSYPEGVRENGGQYTHAGIWFIKAFAMLGEYNTAYELFKLINPINICATAEGNKRYKGEPYVLAGDVHINGRMGWSWYTGSAAWCYKVLLEDILGVSVESNTMRFAPRKISGLESFAFSYRYKDSVYYIQVSNTGAECVTLDGARRDDTLSLALVADGATHTVTVEY